MSLSRFFRDYVYIPLGGNRKNHLLNIFIVWFLTGVWHGASVNFILWGLFLATVICLENILHKHLKIEMPIIIGNVYCIFISIISFSFFYFDDLSRLRSFFDIFNNFSWADVETIILLKNNSILLIISILFSLPVYKIFARIISILFDKKLNKLVYALAFVRVFVFLLLLTICSILLVGETNNPFLYFRF